MQVLLPFNKKQKRNAEMNRFACGMGSDTKLTASPRSQLPAQWSFTNTPFQKPPQNTGVAYKLEVFCETCLENLAEPCTVY